MMRRSFFGSTGGREPSALLVPDHADALRRAEGNQDEVARRRRRAFFRRQIIVGRVQEERQQHRERALEIPWAA